MAKTFDIMPKIENPLKNESQGSFFGLSKKRLEASYACACYKN